VSKQPDSRALDELEIGIANSSPLGLAAVLTKHLENPLSMPAHLRLLNRALLDVAGGDCDRLLVTMPPRHGKSETCSHYFPAWFLGTFPEKRVLLAGHGADFASSWGRKARDTLLDCNGRGVFGAEVREDLRQAHEWETTEGGGMITAGVGGSITGRGAHLLIIDDPVKNSEEAMSPTYQAKTWDWYGSTALTRLEPGGVVVLMQTRWAANDLAGRVLSDEFNDPQDIARWRRIDFPALAEADDALGRHEGEALWPERYPVAVLEAIRRREPFWFPALYQQRPVPRGGGFFKAEWFQYVDRIPSRVKIIKWVRYWDLAGTEGGGDWTAGVLMGVGDDGNYYVADVVHEQFGPGGVRNLVCTTAEADGAEVRIVLSQDPAQAGKDQIASYQREKRLQPFSVTSRRESGGKDVRAAPYASKCEAGMVYLVRSEQGRWNREYVGELTAWNPADASATDDQVDASSGAFAEVATPRGPAVATRQSGARRAYPK